MGGCNVMGREPVVICINGVGEFILLLLLLLLAAARLLVALMIIMAGRAGLC